MQISATRHSSKVSSGRTVGFGSLIGSDVDTDASCTRVSSGGVAAEATKGVSETGASATAAAVSRGSGSGVAALPTNMAEGTTAGSGSPGWTPARAAAEAIALAGSPAPAFKDAAPLVAPRSPVGVEEPKAVPHKITHARQCRDLTTGLPPALGP